jgi:MFS family permease
MTAEKNKTSIIVLVALLTPFLLQGGNTVLNPLVQSMAEYFPDIAYGNITILVTVAYISYIPTSIVVGYIVGRFVSYRNLTIFGLALNTVVGIIPFFVHENYVFILLTRILFGVSLGILMPMGNANLANAFKNNESMLSRMISVGVLILNVGGVVLINIAGLLALSGWYFAFLTYAVGIVAVLLALFLPKDAVTKERSERPRLKIPGVIWILGIYFLLVMLATYPVNLNLSSILAAREMGDTAVSAFVLSFYQWGGFIGAPLFALLFRFFNKYSLIVCIGASAVGILMVYLSHNLILTIAGEAIIGIMMAAHMGAILALIGKYCLKDSVGMGTSIVFSFSFGSMFIASFWIQLIELLTGDVYEMPLLVGAVLAVVLSVVMFFVLRNLKDERAEESVGTE